MTSLKGLKRFSEWLPASERMPVLFVGHGSPMNAIEDNAYSRAWRKLGSELPKPKAILCISAHWETRETYVTAMEKPRTIHDFGGFPKALFEVQYPAPGSPEVALMTQEAVKTVKVGLDDHQWGLDHGCWSVVKNMFPDADVPVLQLSLDHFKSPDWHYELARELSLLREKGVLIMGSGNMVHNLRLINWKNPAAKYDWAEEVNEKFKELIAGGNHKELIHYSGLGREAQLAIPTPEHYLPLLYVLGLQSSGEKAEFFNDDTWGPISMTSVKLSAV